jgi:4-hydroxy-tetrahydrodipicolinate synthase
MLAVPRIPQRTLRPNVTTRLSPGHYRGMSALFRGPGVALLTLFHDDGSIDAGATADLARELVERGMRAVLVAGTTGEAATLTNAERSALIAAIRQAIPDGGEDLPGYFKAVAGAAQGRPVLAYHFPRVYPPGITVEALAGLPIAGQKDSSGDPNRLLDELEHYSGDTYVGSSALLVMAGQLGATGALLALGNVEPKRCVAAFAGDAKAQREITDRHLAAGRGGVPALKRILAEDLGRPVPIRVG